MLFNKNGLQKQADFDCTSKPFRLNPADSHMVRFGQRRIWYYGVFFCFGEKLLINLIRHENFHFFFLFAF